MDDNLSGHSNLDQTGQHYMIDKKLIRYIIDEAMLLPDDIVLEIGYGHGELTKELAKKCKVIAVDIIKTELAHKNVVTITGNILDMFPELYRKYGFNKIVSNIPYDITEPLMRQIFKFDIEMIILCVGKNFSDILTRKDSRIGIIASNLYEIELLKIVKPKSFRPMPQTDSAIISIGQRNADSVSKASAIYKQLVLLDDKKLKNCFEKILPYNKRKTKEMTSSKIFDKKIYALTNKEFIELDMFINGLE